MKKFRNLAKILKIGFLTLGVGLFICAAAADTEYSEFFGILKAFAIAIIFLFCSFLFALCEDKVQQKIDEREEYLSLQREKAQLAHESEMAEWEGLLQGVRFNSFIEATKDL